VKKCICAPNKNETKLACIELEMSDVAYNSAQPCTVCNTTCKTPPKNNCLWDSTLEGSYRGIRISGDGTPHGEWDLQLGDCSAELRNSSGLVWKAAVSHGGAMDDSNGLTFTLGKQGPIDAKKDRADQQLQLGNGNPTGPQVIHALGTKERGPLTTRLILAMSKINGKIPVRWSDEMPTASGGMVLDLDKCLSDKPAPPVPGGTYCDPNAKPPQNCPPYPGHHGSHCPKCAHPPCLCPGNYPPPPPAPPGFADCDFKRLFPPAPPPPSPGLASSIDER
jgi:hypothetical protein